VPYSQALPSNHNNYLTEDHSTWYFNTRQFTPLTLLATLISATVARHCAEKDRLNPFLARNVNHVLIIEFFSDKNSPSKYLCTTGYNCPVLQLRDITDTENAVRYTQTWGVFFSSATENRCNETSYRQQHKDNSTLSV
jgi:hypothetical protein